MLLYSIIFYLWLKTFREVELLARLSHPHVVRYYDNWLELKEAGPHVAAGDAGKRDLIYQQPYLD